MGLEDKGKPSGLPADQEVLDNLRKGLSSMGWVPTDFGFSLARQTDATDVTKDNRRVLYYIADKKDYESYRLLVDHKLPVFSAVMSPIAQGISSIELPPTARALDSMKFPDQEPQAGFMGSFEIMDSVAHLLARIYRHTGNMPEELGLGRFALVPGEEDIIKLIPPLKLVPKDDWDKELEGLRQDLETQDPDHEHGLQIQHLKEAFEHFLEDEKR